MGLNFNPKPKEKKKEEKSWKRVFTSKSYLFIICEQTKVEAQVELIHRWVNEMGLLHPLHFSIFPFKERSLYGVTRPQFVHLANLSSFPSLSLIE